MKEHFKKAMVIAGANFFCWRKDYRVWFVFLMEGFLVGRYLIGLTIYGLQYQKSCTPFLLPLLFADGTIANGLLKILLYFGLIVLLCNAPFRDDRIHYLVIRSGRGAWWLGQCLYILGASLVYLLFLTLMSMLMVVPILTFKPYWGSVFSSLLGSDAAVISQYTVGLMIPREVVQVIYPFAGQYLTFLIVWLSFSFLGFLTFCINEVTGKMMMGSLVSAFLVLLDPVVRWLAYVRSRYWWYYLSPVNWSSIEHWDILGVNRPLRGRTVLVCSLLLLMILGVATRIAVKKREVDAMSRR